MLQDNPLLAQLKQQLQSQTPRVEGVVKGTEKGFGFLEVDAQKSYFIPPPEMKKVMHGDRIVARLHTVNGREAVEPESLSEAFLTRFIGRLRQQKNGRLAVVPDHPLLNTPISCRPLPSLEVTLNEGDWVVAEMRRHPLKGDRQFYAEVTELITVADDPRAPWRVTLARHGLAHSAPVFTDLPAPDEQETRDDLQHLPFVTIDNASTRDMDDALCVEALDDGSLRLWVAIADPAAWIAPGSELDHIARQRAFTTYLPGIDIPMLPRELADDQCSLHEGVRRPALVCQVKVDPDGALSEARFCNAWITSRARLVYDTVSDWLEGKGEASDPMIMQQLRRLQQLCQVRQQWRAQHAIVFQNRPDYRFVLDEQGEVSAIVVEQRRIANQIVEEAMIAANICAAEALRDHYGYGIFNTHRGFEPAQREQVVALLQEHGIDCDAEALGTLDGFCALRRTLEALPTGYLDARIRRFMSFAEISVQPGPHFALGLPVYATWTSPIRKYGDLVNQRLLKAMLQAQSATAPDTALTEQLNQQRRLNRTAERDVADWLYARFLQSQIGTRFEAEIIDISRGGMRVRLLENGAVAFIPAPLIHAVRDELTCSQEKGQVIVNGAVRYQLADTLTVTLAEVRMETRSLIARPAD